MYNFIVTYFVLSGLTLSLIFESYDGGRDSIERLTQGLLIAAQESPDKSLIVSTYWQIIFQLSKCPLKLICFIGEFYHAPITGLGQRGFKGTSYRYVNVRINSLCFACKLHT